MNEKVGERRIRFPGVQPHRGADSGLELGPLGGAHEFHPAFCETDAVGRAGERYQRCVGVQHASVCAEERDTIGEPVDRLFDEVVSAAGTAHARRHLMGPAEMRHQTPELGKFGASDVPCRRVLWMVTTACWRCVLKSWPDRK